MKRITKVVATIGPACNSEETIEKLVENGLDIARFNFSHAQYDEFKRSRDLVKKYAEKHGKDIKILMDLQGPRMRVGIMPEEGVKLIEGETRVFSTDQNNKDAIFINDEFLHETIEEGHPIYLANGDMELMVEKVDGSNITVKVVRGGILHSRKGVNVPETNVKTPSITEKDLRDIEFGLLEKVDIVALSFVKSGDDIRELRKLLGDSGIKICAKIEIKMALRNIDDIIKESDIIMVARGDLGIELPLEEVPLAQKDLVKKCNEAKTPAIVATQMLMSMVDHHRPTRAEVSDVANAVLDGAWATMLSDETAFGKYPVHAVEYMVKVIKQIENYNMKTIGQQTTFGDTTYNI